MHDVRQFGNYYTAALLVVYVTVEVLAFICRYCGILTGQGACRTAQPCKGHCIFVTVIAHPPKCTGWHLRQILGADAAQQQVLLPGLLALDQLCQYSLQQTLTI